MIKKIDKGVSLCLDTFPPNYAPKRYVYVNYTAKPDGTTIELYVLDYIGGAVYPLTDPTVAVQPPLTGIELAPAQSEQTGQPGAQVMHTLHMTNTGTIPDSYGIDIRQAT